MRWIDSFASLFAVKRVIFRPFNGKKENVLGQIRNYEWTNSKLRTLIRGDQGRGTLVSSTMKS
jgi:hypothetical protein